MDNLSRNRVMPENGEMSIKLSGNMDKVAICISVFVNFNRYSDLVPLFDFRHEYNEEPFGFVYGKA